MTCQPFWVVKVGGSLYDWPKLGPQLRRWLNSVPPRALLIPGGGPAADLVRSWDRCHHLGEERSHRLALRSLTFAAGLLADLLQAPVVTEPDQATARWRAGETPILDVARFAAEDEGRPGRLPHGWVVTSDALAARVAVVWGAARVVLLKSAAVPEGARDWGEAARLEYVDAVFPLVVANGPAAEAVDLRSWNDVAN